MLLNQVIYYPKIPLRDFDINAKSTIYLMEAIRKYSKKSTVVYFSTNKVYGDNPNKLKLKEMFFNMNIFKKKIKKVSMKI